jgi:hypothetical protein
LFQYLTTAQQALHLDCPSLVGKSKMVFSMVTIYHHLRWHDYSTKSILNWINMYVLVFLLRRILVQDRLATHGSTAGAAPLLMAGIT